ncbi:MAG: hypothetical protein ACK40G_10265 [Cytophagaceae bacterium]
MQSRLSKLLVIFTVIFAVSCGKDSDPEPNNNVNTNPNAELIDVTTLPFSASPVFLPTGFWQEEWGDKPEAMDLSFPAGGCDDNRNWENSCAIIKYTVGEYKWGGLTFLNNGDWAAEVPIAAGVKKVRLAVKADQGLKYSFTFFPGANNTNMGTHNGVGNGNWQEIAIDLNGVSPTVVSHLINLSYEAPTSANAGDVLTLQIKNIIFDKE